MQRFVLRITPVDAWPTSVPKATAYAFAAEHSLNDLAARIAQALQAEVITEDGVFNGTNCRSPKHPPVPSETLA